MTKIFLAIFGLSAYAFGSNTTALFDLSSPATGPFPANAFTVGDPLQKTGIRIHLPMPDCNTQPSACGDVALLNQLDGFNLQPRIRVCFSGPVDTSTLYRGVKFVVLNNLTHEEAGIQKLNHVVNTNQGFYDPQTNCFSAKPDEYLDQHRRYALVVTDAVQDRSGKRIKDAKAFRQCAGGNSNGNQQGNNENDSSGTYCDQLSGVMEALGGLIDDRIVAASIFTTLSATDWVQKARDQVQTSAIAVVPLGVFNISELAAMTWQAQTNLFAPPLAIPIPLAALAGVGRVAFGLYTSPIFLNPNGFISTTPTAGAINPPSLSAPVGFHVFLPAGPVPAGGYPVMIYGHGFGDSQFGAPTAVASTFAQAGFVTIAIDAMGHGFGPGSTVVLTDKNGHATQIPAPGRSFPDPSGTTVPPNGCVILPGPIGTRDCVRQTVVDLMQLVRAIGAGMNDLSVTQIFYLGQSFGSMYGPVRNAVEPNIRAAAFNVGGGTVPDAARLQKDRQLAIAYLGLHSPPLLNKGADFDDNYPFRNRPVIVNNVPGAPAIQDAFEVADWVGVSGDPAAFAMHIGSSPLDHRPAKPMMIQFAQGDQEVPNPANSNLIRAANALAVSRYFRNDLARAAVPALPENAHRFLTTFDSPAQAALALASQSQVAGFFASGGAVIPDINPLLFPIFGQNVFEVPTTLPESLGFTR